MISPKEKRFLKYWDDQKRGGKWSYLLVYTLGWSVIIFFVPLASSFVIDTLGELRLYRVPLWAAIVTAIVLGFFVALLVWIKNERKARRIRAMNNFPV